MSLEAQLEALSLPEDQEFPGTPQALLNLIAQYMAITGLDDFNGVNYGPVTPSAEDQDKPWFKTDESFNPIGWFAWDGSAWSPIPTTAPSGPTASRPTAPTTGQFYYDTGIRSLLISDGTSGWVTAGGSPGDIKHVTASTLEIALERNPGWSHYEEADGRVLAGADGSTYAHGATAGANEVILETDQLPSHAHEIATSSGLAALRSGVDLDLGGPDYGSQVPDDDVETSTVGDGEPVDVRQPTLYVWVLVKN